MSRSVQEPEVEQLRPRQVAEARLASQRITRPPAATPASVAAQLLAIQSQDPARRALGRRPASSGNDEAGG